MICKCGELCLCKICIDWLCVYVDTLSTSFWFVCVVLQILDSAACIGNMSKLPALKPAADVIAKKLWQYEIGCESGR